MTDLWGKVPYQTLPTEVLLSMRDQIRKELGRREWKGEEFGNSSRIGLYGRRIGKDSRGRYPNLSREFTSRACDIDALMAEDWSHLFPVGCEERRFYVYCHADPRGKKLSKPYGEFQVHIPGTPFYIGKGTGRRAWDLSRNEGHGVMLKQLRDLGIADSQIVTIIRDNLTEREALELESKWIYFFGTKFETERKGILLNLDFPPRLQKAPVKME